MFDWHNIESEGMERYAEVTPSRLKRLYARQTARKMKTVELDLIRSDAHHVVCSERERKQLASLVPDTSRVAVVENGVATEAFEHFTPAGMQGNRIVFVGLMAYHANVDAVLWFAREVWPALRERFPDKIFTVVGANPVPAVLDLRSEPGVEVTGTVEDVKPFYASAFAAVAPLRTGAGTRLKILEAMAARVPVISTALGAEGLDVVDKSQLLLAETPDEWVSAVSALQNSETYTSLSRNGYELAKTRYDWQRIRNTLSMTYNEWLKRQFQR
jgi:glycosyltransferase involved in cell wall biosynthesis